MFRKVLSLVLVGVMAISLFACGGVRQLCEICKEWKDDCKIYEVGMSKDDPDPVTYYVCKKCEKTFKDNLMFGKILSVRSHY